MNDPAVIADKICFDRGRHYRAKIGYVLLATEQTIEDDVVKLTPEGGRRSLHPHGDPGQHQQRDSRRPG